MSSDGSSVSPLDSFRKMSHLNSARLAEFMIGAEALEFRNQLVEKLRSEPLFSQHPHLQRPQHHPQQQCTDEVIPTAAEDAAAAVTGYGGGAAAAVDAAGGLSLTATRRLTQLRVKRLAELQFAQFPTLQQHWWQRAIVDEVLGGLDWSLYVKTSVVYDLPAFTVLCLGTERHQPLQQAIANRQISCCFALTEVGHGSNTRHIDTTATFDSTSGQFVLHTPHFTAAKCWAGGLGQTSTLAVVFAQLYTINNNNNNHGSSKNKNNNNMDSNGDSSDGGGDGGGGTDGGDGGSGGSGGRQCHGLHALLVPIRCQYTHRPLAGVTVGDMGHKLGLNGVDNGYLMFNRYRVARECLLNGTADVTADGVYVSHIEDDTARFAASLGALSIGRVGITRLSQVNLRSAVTIAVRYTAVRRQFSLTGHAHRETAVLNYPQMQWRLLPYLAATYVWCVTCNKLNEEYYNFIVRKFSGEQSTELLVLGAELHALSCGSKPVSGWLARDGIQESREACGGHGYLTVSGLLDTRSAHDGNLTYEGDNNVLIQQLSNFLLRVRRNSIYTTPLGSVAFLQPPAAPPAAAATNAASDGAAPASASAPSLARASCEADVSTVQFCVQTYEWLVRYLLSTTVVRLAAERGRCDGNVTEARHSSQVHAARPLAEAFIQLFALRTYARYVETCSDDKTRTVLNQLAVLYALWTLDNQFVSYICQGGYMSGGQVSLMQSACRALCRHVLPHALSLVDALAPPDFLLKSALGHSDGRVYERLWESFRASSNTTVDWWRLCVPTHPIPTIPTIIPSPTTTTNNNISNSNNNNSKL